MRKVSLFFLENKNLGSRESFLEESVLEVKKMDGLQIVS